MNTTKHLRIPFRLLVVAFSLLFLTALILPLASTAQAAAARETVLQQSSHSTQPSTAQTEQSSPNLATASFNPIMVKCGAYTTFTASGFAPYAALTITIGSYPLMGGSAWGWYTTSSGNFTIGFYVPLYIQSGLSYQVKVTAGSTTIYTGITILGKCKKK